MSLQPHSRDPWGDFWASKDGGAGGGCLPSRWAGIEKQQRAAWQDFAALMPKGGHVLDLATGDGRVMGWLLGARRDLKCFGVDLAPAIPRPPKGSRSRGGTAMEALPVGDSSQDGVTSQFGFEYGNASAVLGEVARVLKPGGKAALMVHRLDGSILEHNLPRRDGLLWVLDEYRLIEKAHAALAMRSLLPGVSPSIGSAPGEAKRLFGAGSAGWELAEAISQTLMFGQGDQPHNVRTLLDTLEAKARNEIGRIDTLEAACRSVSDEAALTRRFGEAGLEVTSRHALDDGTGARPFADHWLLRHGKAAVGTRTS